MASNQAGEVALSWADSFIRDLLTEEERYQDVIKDLSNDAIASTVRQLDRASEEYLTGIEILQNRATYSTSLALIEVDEETNEDASTVSTETDRANKEADEEADEDAWRSERATSAVLIEINADIDRLVDEVRESNESTLSKVERWIATFSDDLHNMLWGWIPELTNNAAIYLAALPAQVLFEAFKDFFFEED